MICVRFDSNIGIQINDVHFDSNMTHQMAIDHVASWLLKSEAVIFTGRILNANKMAKPRDVFELCIKYDAGFWASVYGYVLTKNKIPGQKSKIFALFRDEILLSALCLCRACQTNTPLELAQIQTYIYKDAMLKDTNCSPRAIIGWEVAQV